ncbi:hypothetical protein Q428_07355 [Fervidicella metallireducens AeB]|uniref:Uncharacterized protein n=1 Tax=Fervidicella metallireducens AeB TaxID=1403537 RepID=A0A017RV14_9CLOT|nr:hypothetical protein [Fervidicella metallireducens]EYE88583.1 hypothetical protein Q428_07355 [Fervidicella metallireducens AeB]
MTRRVMIKKNLFAKLANGTEIVIKSGDIYNLEAEYSIEDNKGEKVRKSIIYKDENYMPLVLNSENLEEVRLVFMEYFFPDFSENHKLASIADVMKDIKEQKKAIEEKKHPLMMIALIGEVIECKEGIYVWDKENQIYKILK